MARAQSVTTMAALLWGLVIFVILAVIFGFLALIVNLRNRDMVVDLQSAQEQLARYVKPDERQSPAVIEVMNSSDVQSEGSSVVGALLADVAWLRQIITGQANTSSEAIRTEMTTLGIPEGTTLLQAIRSNRINLEAERAHAEKLKSDLESAQEALATLERSKTDLQRAYENGVETIRTQMASVQADYDAFRSRVTADQEALAARIKEVQNEGQRQINTHRATIDTLNDQITAYKRHIADLQRQLGTSGGMAVDPREMPDGRIASIVSEENLVYINRGRRDRIQLGMTFQVYDDERIIKLNEYDELTGKATIEVINLAENSALARVVVLGEGRVINEDDVIANVVYDPEAQFKFTVYGEFDIDNIGLATDSDRKRIETMVTEWGGELVPIQRPEEREEGETLLSYDVDYLVLGAEPELPAELRDVIDPRKIMEHEAAMQRYETYQLLISEAKQFNIPVLNQNRFLKLVGYYRR